MKRKRHIGKSLKPAQGVRYVRPRVCAFCAHCAWDDNGLWQCERPNGPHGDSNDGDQYLTSCIGGYAPDITLDEVVANA